MSQPINYEAYRLGTKDGEVKFGHLSVDGQIYSVMLRNMQPSGDINSKHYIAMIQTGEEDWQKNSTVCRSSGQFAIQAGDTAKKGNPSVWIKAEGGDIDLIAPHGKIRMNAQDVEIICSGASGETGNFSVKANEKIILDAGQMIDIHSKVNMKLVSEKTVEVIGKSICEIAGNSLDFCEGADQFAATSGLGRKGGSGLEGRLSTGVGALGAAVGGTLGGIA